MLTDIKRKKLRKQLDILCDALSKQHDKAIKALRKRLQEDAKRTYPVSDYNKLINYPHEVLNQDKLTS